MQSLFAVVLAASYAIASPTPLLPRAQAPEASAHIDATVNATIYPPAVLASDLPQNIQITCTNCYVKGDVSVSAGGDNIGTTYEPSSNFTSTYVEKAGFDFSSTWVGLAFESFSAHLEFDVTVTPSNSSNSGELAISLLGAPISISIPVIPGLTLSLDPQLHGSVNVSEAVTFKHSFDMTVPSGSALLIPVFHPNSTIAVGFNETSTTVGNYESSTDDIEMTFQFSLRPKVDLSITVLEDTFTFGAFADLPKVTVTVEQVENVTSTCEPATTGGSGTYAQTYSRLTKVTPSIGFDFALTFDADTWTPLDFDAPLTSANTSTCLQFDASKNALVTPGSDNKTASGAGAGDGNAAVVGARLPGMLLAAVVLAAGALL